MVCQTKWDWKIQKRLEEAKQTTDFEIDPLTGDGDEWNPGRSNSINSIEDYGLDEADQEVDDFLAGLSDDEEDNENSDDGNDEEEEDDEVTATSDGHDSFIRDMYRKKRTTTEVEEDDDEEKENPMDVDDNKKRKIESNGGDEHNADDEEIDVLEQALLDGFDDLEGWKEKKRICFVCRE